MRRAGTLGMRISRSLRRRTSRAWGRVVRAAFDAPWVGRVLRRRQVVVLGDSHVELIDGWFPRGWWFDVTSVGGATASGIRNPNSATEALPRFEQRLGALRPHQSVLVQLGEVDCGYVIWRRARTHGLDVDSQLADTVDKYMRFLAEVRDRRPRELLVMSAPFPTLPDNSAEWGEIARRRSDVQVSQQERTQLTARFNRAVAAACADAGLMFVDASRGQLDDATGLIRSDLVRHGEGDHHLTERPYRALIRDALGRATAGR